MQNVKIKFSLFGRQQVRYLTPSMRVVLGRSLVSLGGRAYRFQVKTGLFWRTNTWTYTHIIPDINEFIDYCKWVADKRRKDAPDISARVDDKNIIDLMCTNVQKSTK